MANWWEGVTLTLEVGFDSNPLDATQTYTDITTYWTDRASTFRGSQSTWMEPSPGTFEFALDNSDRRFDPTNTAGPHYGDLKPMKRVRLSVTKGGATRTVFTGYVTSWRQEWRDLEGRVRLVAVEGFATIGRFTLPRSAYQVEVEASSPWRYWPLQDTQGTAEVGTAIAVPNDWQTTDLGWPMGETVGLAPNQVDDPTRIDTTTILQTDALPSAPQAVEGWFRVDELNSISFGAFYDAQTYLTVSMGGFFGIYRPDAVTVSYSNAAENARTSASFVLVARPTLGETYHIAAFRSGAHVVVMINGSDYDIPLVGGTHTNTASSGVRITSSNQGTDPVTVARTAIGHPAVYTSAPSRQTFRQHYNAGLYAWSGAHGDFGWETDGERINRALDDAGWPTGQRDIVTGSVRQAPYLPAGRSVLEYIREVAASGAGFIFFDVDGNICYRDREWMWTYSHPTGDELEWNGQALQWGTTDLDWGAGPVVFTDDGTGLTYIAGDPAASDVDTIRNVITVAYERGGITQRDATSITEFGGEYPETITARTITIAADASNLAAYRLRTSKDPADTFPEIICSLRDGDPALQFAGVLGVDLGKTVQVTRTPMSTGSQITRYGMLLGVAHEVDHADWISTLALTAAPESADDAGYGIVGTGTAGASTIVPY